LQSMSTPPLAVGIVGYGYMGQIRRRTVDDHPELELAGICDPVLEPGSDSVHARVFPTYQGLVGASMDVVFVCTPNCVAPEVVIYGLEHGCHIFCEKPPGRNLGDIKRIIAAEKAHPELRLIFGFNHGHHPGIVDAKAIVDSGSLGRILWVRGVYGKSGGNDFEKSWRNDPQVSGGGILLDQGIHMLDLFRYFCGDFVEAMGMTTTAFWNVAVEDNAFVMLRSSDGVLAQLHSSATLWKHTFRLEIGLENGYLVVSGLLSKTGSYGRETLLIGRKPARGEKVALGNPREETTYYDTDLSWDVQVNHLVECIRDNRPVSDSTSLDALKVMEICEEVYRQEALRRRL